MAEMLVSLTIDKLLPFLVEEARLLRGIHKGFADIKLELESIQAFLKDADRKASSKGENNNEGVKIWVNQVIQEAFRIEDIIDDYMIFMMNQQPRRLGCVASLYKFFGVVKTSKTRHQIASDIKDVMLAVRGIKERSERYDLQIQQGSNNSIRQQNGNWHDPRMAAIMDEADVIGFEAPKSRLIDWLVEGRVERTVVSVVGMGGQGKTTLAKKVFDSKEVDGHFGCRAWITVSESYSVEGLLRDMLSKLYKQADESLPHDIAQMDRGSLIDLVRNFLQKKRYVLVFDDVWNVHFWDDIEFAVIDKNNGSRIFITTRNLEVANSCRRSSFVEVHELQPLTHEQSWELFNRKVFRFDYDGCCPKELIDISQQILKQCKGLPLAIVVIGGLLSTKEKNTVEWDNFNKNLSSELNNDSHLIGITKILGLSYDGLPYYLKPFLLYFGIYPEDYEIESERLIRQWIAEGFVKEERGKTLEEVAERCLTELIRRSLVQVSLVGIDGKAKTCRVHDLIRVMVIENFEDLCFCNHISEDGQSILSGRMRRLSIGTTCSDLICRKWKREVEENQDVDVRSVLVFANGRYILNDFVRLIVTKYKRLKVFDFEDVEFVNVPNNLESLIHLKYLRLTGVSELPKSIGLLQNLETLDVWGGTDIIIMPEGISKLRKLRHLLGNFLDLIELKNSIGGLKSLQTLMNVVLTKGGDEELELIRNMGKLMQLKEFRLFSVQKQLDEGVLLSSSISNMQHLEKLTIYTHPSEEIDLNLISFSPKLQNISLTGKLTRFPEGILKLQNLIELKLGDSHLIDDPVKSLKDMPNLLSLRLDNNYYKGESLHFQEGGFPKLKELYITRLDNLNSIVIEKGALPSLKKLELRGIPNLQRVPPGMQYLEKLQVLNIFVMPTEFVERISPDGGSDHCLIHHVPHVKVES